MENIQINLAAIFKWLHIIAGITWIGLLYFFNFINGHVAATMDADSKKKVVPELMPRALYWFRWGAAWTWVTGVILLYLVFWIGGQLPADFTSDDLTGKPANMYIHIMLTVTFIAVFLYDFMYTKFASLNVRVLTIISFLLIGIIVFCMKHCAGFEPRAYNIHIGAMFGTMMAFNVWFRIWPAQQKIITAIKEGNAPDGSDLALAGLRSKHNTYMSVPLIWTMINEHTIVFNMFHLPYGFELMIMIALGWHIVFQLYKRSAKVKGF